jgi:tetratricopeptide (TPR) repeat protein
MIVADSQGRKSDAKIHSAKAVDRLDQLFRLGNLTMRQRYDAARYYANIAINAINLHRYEQGRQYARKSMEAGAFLPQEPKIRAGALSLIGSSLRSEGRVEEALQSLQEAQKIAESPAYSNATERAMDMYGILLREARTLGQDGGVSLGRAGEAIPVYRKAVDLMEEQASKDPRDQNARDRLATSSRELAELLVESDPQQSLAVFDLGIQRLREVKNNARARRREAQALAESSYPLRRLHQFPEARRRIDAAFALLRETKDYPADRVNPDSEVTVVLGARADYESDAGAPRRAGAIYERLLAAMMTTNPDVRGYLADASKISALYFHMADVYRRAGESVKADEMNERRLKLWRQWDGKLPHNEFVQRQLAQRSD